MSTKTKVKIPAWALKVQAVYRQEFKVGDIVHYHDEDEQTPRLGVITGSTAGRGDEEVPVDQLEKAAVRYSVWFQSGESAWYDEDGLTLVKRG